MNTVGARYSKIEYEAALGRLGIRPPATREQILTAYRAQVKRYHPDRFFTPGEKGVATKRIQAVNAARDYLLEHLEQFTAHAGLKVEMSSPTPTSPMPPEDESPGQIDSWDILAGNSWTEVLFMPFTVLHLILRVACSVLVVIFGGWGRPDWKGPSTVARLWLLAGPHVVTYLAFMAAPGMWARLWFGATFFLMLGTELIVHLLGASASHSYRHEVARAESLVRAQE